MAEEETGIVVEVASPPTAIDQMAMDRDGLARSHYVIVDYVARPVTGSLAENRMLKK